MLEKEFNYYIKNQETLLQQYLGSYIVIKDEQVIGSYKTQLEAYTTTAAHHAVGTFLIQHCLPGSESYSQTFHSRVIVRAAK